MFIMLKGRAIAILAFVGCMRCAFAYGPWLEWTPIGGVELDDSGLVRAELERRLDVIERETVDRPMIVTRTKSLAMMFDHVRLAVNTNDLFVHWHPDGSLLPLRTIKRMKAFSSQPHGSDFLGPGTVFGGAFTSKLDTSHTCPDWESIIELGPTGLAERARRRKETAHANDERLFLDCVVEVYEALARECLRWADFSERKGMHEVAAVLRENAAHEPRTFREALQWALVYDRAQETEGEDVRSQGIFDRLFVKFYRDDLAAGRETRESAKRLVADFYTRLYSQRHPNNKNISFGGYGPDGKPVWNELTELDLSKNTALTWLESARRAGSWKKCRSASRRARIRSCSRVRKRCATCSSAGGRQRKMFATTFL